MADWASFTFIYRKWQPTAVPGICVHNLLIDRPTDLQQQVNWICSNRPTCVFAGNFCIDFFIFPKLTLILFHMWHTLLMRSVEFTYYSFAYSYKLVCEHEWTESSTLVIHSNICESMCENKRPIWSIDRYVRGFLSQCILAYYTLKSIFFLRPSDKSKPPANDSPVVPIILRTYKISRSCPSPKYFFF